MTDWTQVPDPEFTAEYLAINAEMGRRRTLETGPAAQDRLNESQLKAEGVTQGEPWRQPSGGHDAYPRDWKVSHEGKDWVSLITANVWEPGVSGWREEGNDWPAWVQPTGAHDAYQVGAQVTHNGLRWVSESEANVWEPGVFGWTEEA
jgi:hypothetical protein